MTIHKIHVGIIGLSADQNAWATMTHAVPLKGEPLSEFYDITAIGTSSPETAKAAAKAHGVSEGKAYSNPQDIANDKDVDMVVVSVKVPMHQQLTMPALKARKDVFVEWPLGANLAQAEEMSALAKQQGVKNIVGLQARQQAVVLKAKEIIDSGKMGRVISTNIINSTSAIYILPPKNLYLNDPNSGASLVSIPVTHTLDAMLFAIGSEFDYLNATLNTNFPDLLVQNAEGKGTHAVKRTGADSVTVAGVLKNGVSASIVWTMTTPATPDHLSWIIAGEKASLKIESDNAQLQMAPDIKLWIYTSSDEDARGSIYTNPKPPQWETVELPKAPYFGGVGEVYQAFAKGKTEALVSFEEATKRHRMIDAIFRSAKNGTRETYES